MNKPKVLVILGPTATGKSGLAVRLARKFNGEIISADSRQVYKGLDIGTGKAPRDKISGKSTDYELRTTYYYKGIPHHLLDVASPKRKFTVARYKKLAEKAVDDILARGKLPIICGGTGFYIQALADSVVLPDVPPNPALRKKLGRKPPASLIKILKKLDPVRAKAIDRKNSRRLIRAIEIAGSLGKVPKLTNNLISTTDNTLFIGIDLPDRELKKKIKKRLRERIRMGMIGEAKRLHKDGLSYKRMRELGLEYKFLADFLENKISKEEMTKLLETAIWQYAKRQRTWFKRDKRIKWFTPIEIERIALKDIGKIEKEARKFLKS